MIRNKRFGLRVSMAIAAGSLGLLLASSSPLHAQLEGHTLVPLWSIQPQTPYDWVSTVNHQRGLAFNPVTGSLLTASRYPTTVAAVYIVDSTTGTLKGNLSVNGVKTDMNFPLNMIDVADDGVIYACTLAVDSATIPADPVNNNGPFRIYRWANETANPELVYEGDPSDNDPLPAGRRFGDTFDVRGAGVNTEILCSTRGTNMLAWFRTADGTNFTHTRIYAQQMIYATTINGLAWGTNNSFYVKGDQGVATGRTALQHFNFDEFGFATLIKNHDNLAQRGGVIGYEPTRGLLAVISGFVAAAAPQELRLYKDTIAGFVLQDHPEAFRPFPALNANGNGTGSAVFGNGKLFALASNNGIVAFDIQEKTSVPQVFWTETGGFSGPNLGSVWAASFDGNGRTPIAAGLNRPIGIALDYTNKFVYWAEDGFNSTMSQIVRAKFDGSGQTVLFSAADHGLMNSQMLRLDLANGHVYWIDFHFGVMRGNLDGSGFTMLGGHPGAVKYTALDLDPVNRHIYYGDPTQMGVLFRMDFDGQNNIEIARTISTTDFAFNSIRLDVPNNHIYYIDTGTHEIRRMNLD
ncbi:MAG TPA: hypothetical protein VN673_01275, partial [Clostridia bacterium]|nr:hypothetical protein [Clostridia bacterium]